MFTVEYLKQFVKTKAVVIVQFSPTVAPGEWECTVLSVNENAVVLKVDMLKSDTKESYTAEMHVPVGKGMIKAVRGNIGAKVALATFR